MKYLIFGGTGFVGKNLASFLKDHGAEVYAVSNSGRDQTISIDITSKADFSKINFVPDVVVNCASKVPSAGKKSNDPDFLKELFLTNVVGAANICNWAVGKKVRRILNCSTMVAVKKPWPVPLSEDSVGVPEGVHAGYSLSKLSQEKIMNECVKGSETQILHARLSAVYGPGMKREGIIFNVLQKALAGEKISLRNAEKNSIDLIHVTDVAQYLFKLSKSNEAFDYDVINLGSGKEISVFELSKLITKLVGSEAEIINLDTTESVSRALIDNSLLQSVLTGSFEGFIDLERGLDSLFRNSSKFEEES